MLDIDKPKLERMLMPGTLWKSTNSKDYFIFLDAKLARGECIDLHFCTLTEMKRYLGTIQLNNMFTWQEIK